MRVVALWRYPVKSMQGEQLRSLPLTPSGAASDRQWGVRPVGPDGTSTDEVLAGKRCPALLQAGARVDGDDVVVTLLGGRPLRAGDPATDAALSAWLGREVRLERADAGRPAGYDVPLEDGSVHRAPCPPGSFQDSRSSNLHVLATPTLGDDDVRRYRPNVVVALDGPPFVEDGWVGGDLHLGPAAALVTKRCVRCVLVTRPQPGLPADRTRLTRLRDRATTLGVLARVRTAAEVAEGEPALLDQAAPARPT